MSNGGIVIISLSIDAITKEWLSNPAITSFGISRSDISAKLFMELRAEVNKFMTMHKVEDGTELEYEQLRSKINHHVASYIHMKTRLETIVFTTINEIG